MRTQGEQEDLKDLFQECAMRIWQHAELFDPSRPETSVKKWMNQVAKSTATEFVKKVRRRAKLLGPQIPFLRQSAASPEEGILSSIDSEDRSAELTHAIRQLNPTDARLLQLHLDGIENGDLARILGLSSAAVRTRLSRAKSRMRMVMLKPKPSHIEIRGA